MARFLFVLFDGAGNVPPQLAVAGELVERGHDVRVLGHETLRSRVAAVGAAFNPFVRAPDTDSTSPERDLVRAWEAHSPLGAHWRTFDRLVFGPAQAFGEDVLEELKRDSADIVAIDYQLFGAFGGAEAAGVPAVAMMHTVYTAPTPGVPPFRMGLMPAEGPLGRARDRLFWGVAERALARGFGRMNAAAAELGVAPVRGFNELLGRPRLILVLTSPEFDFAGRLRLPAHVHFTGPVLERRDVWTSPWPENHPDPLVVASFSTYFMDQGKLAARVLCALGQLPVRGLLTLGPALQITGIPVPANVVVRDWVPHLAAFPKARLVVTHAGLGTVHASLASGVPLVCLPQGRDQHDNAARVVAAGAGVRLPSWASQRRVRAAIERALADEQLVAAAARMKDVFAHEDGRVRAANSLEKLAVKRPRKVT